MSERNQEHLHQVALFRYGLIADLLHIKPGTGTLYEEIRNRAARDHEIPGSTRTRVASETIRTWLKRYRRHGFDGLVPRLRGDRGQSRAIPREVADVLLSIKEDHPDLSVPLVIREARKTGAIPEEQPLPPSTVHRLFGAHGLMRKELAQPSDNDRRRFAFEKAGELWMSDVMHGPAVALGADRPNVRRKTYLIAFLDDATRVVPFAAFAFAENTTAFLPIMMQAIMRRGIPLRLFVDNGANYRSRHLALVCAKLGIALIHARPYQPQSKGKQERWFRTVRSQLLTRLTPDDTKSLEALNRRLWAWVEGEYHHAPHRGLDGETPLDRWARAGDDVRYPAPGFDLGDLFLFETKRKVQKDRTVSLDGVVYEVDAALVGQTVTLRFDPSAKKGRPVQVCHDGRKVEDARVVDAYANCFIKRNRPSRTLDADSPPNTPRPGLNLASLDKEND
jgi:transposase InsO family protein